MSGPGSSKGWALAEVVLAGALCALLFFALLDVSWRIHACAERARAILEEETELRNAVQWVTRDLRRAYRVWDARPGYLELEVWDPAGGHGLGMVVYELRGDSLVRDDMGWVKVVARGLADARFSAEERGGGTLVVFEFRGLGGGAVRASVQVVGGSGDW